MSVWRKKGSTAFACVRDRLTSLGFDWPATLVAWTTCLGTGIRLLLAASVVDLGHREAYYIAASRHFALSYFDHLPLSFWIAWATMKLTGAGCSARRPGSVHFPVHRHYLADVP